MASLIQWLKFSGAHKVDGTPVATGTIEFLVPGSTSSYMTVWAEADEATPLTQPVALDAAGRAEVFIKGLAQVRVKDSTGVTIFVIDTDSTNNHNSVSGDTVLVRSSYWNGYSGLGTDFSLNDFTSRIGQTLGVNGFYMEDENSVDCLPRTYKAMIEKYVEPQDYGALADGSNDDTAAIQDAIDRAIAADKPLYLRSGTYRFTTPLTVNGKITILGDGPSHSVLETVEAINGMTIAAGSNAVILSGFSVKVPLTTSGTTALTISTCSSFSANNVDTYGRIGFDVSAISAARLVACNGNTVDGLVSTPAYAFKVGASATLLGCKALSTGGTKAYSYGFDCSGANAKLIGCYVENYGVAFAASATGCVATLCHFKSCGQTTYVTANYSGIAFCTGESNTSGFSSSDASAYVVNIGNISGALTPDGTNDFAGNWISDRTPTSSRETQINTATGSTTTTPVVNGKQDKVCVYTYSGTASTTIENPTLPGGGVVTSVVDGKDMVIILQAGASTTLQVSFGSAFAGAATANVASNTSRQQRFTYNANQGKWIARDAGITLSGVLWP